jgi:hypothetical protein
MDNEDFNNHPHSITGDGEYKNDTHPLARNLSPFLKKCLHDIRNSKSLSMDVLMDINKLPENERLEVLQLYNEMVCYYSDAINNA